MRSFAIIFDADGVLFDSERQSFDALCIAVERLTDGRAIIRSEDFAQLSGRDDKALVEFLRERYGVRLDPGLFRARKLEIYREVVQRDPISIAPGVESLLAQLDAAAVPYAIATSAIRAKLDISLEALGLHDRFSVIATADDVARAKPDPALFLLAAERLGFPPARIFVFEDTINGILAANRAGMFSVAVAGTFAESQLSIARKVVRSLGDVSIALLQEWMGGAT